MSDLTITKLTLKKSGYSSNVEEKKQKDLSTYQVRESLSQKKGSSQRKFKHESCQQVEDLKSKIPFVFHKEDQKLLFASYGNRPLIEVLMKYGKNEEGYSSLQKAVLEKDICSVKILVKAGARVTGEILEDSKRIGDFSLYEVLNRCANNHAPLRYQFTITKSQVKSSGGMEFELDSEEIPISYISKPFFSINTVYLLRGPEGIEAHSTLTKISMGIIYPVEKILDVDDGSERSLGQIRGSALTSQDAKFELLDAHKNLLGISLLQPDRESLKLVSPNNYSRVIAKIRKSQEDKFSVRVYQGKDIQPELLKTFSVFAADTESLFQKKTQLPR